MTNHKGPYEQAPQPYLPPLEEPGSRQGPGGLVATAAWNST